MRMRGKLWVVFGSLFLLGVLLSVWTGVKWQQGLARGEPEDLYLVLLFVIILLGLVGVYIASYILTGRLERLNGLAEEAAFAPALVKVHVTGMDEVAAIASSLEKMRRNLTEGEQARNQLVADVAHELRTPLAILRGQLESLQEEKEKLTPDSLLPLIDETMRLGRLVQDLQQLSLAEAGKLNLDRKWFTFDLLVDEVVDGLQIEAEQKRVSIHIQGRVGGEVYGDMARLRQVLINLLGNAIRHTKSGDQVKIFLTSFEDMVQVAITDYGSSIPPEKLPYLFHRFFRVDDARNRSLGGTGLGLPIAKEFVEAHGGSLTVTSELGEGSTFTVKIPRFPLK